LNGAAEQLALFAGGLAAYAYLAALGGKYEHARGASSAASDPTPTLSDVGGTYGRQS
jgi:hypothetical protein